MDEMRLDKDKSILLCFQRRQVSPILSSHQGV